MYEFLVYGIQNSDCLRPCESTKVAICQHNQFTILFGCFKFTSRLESTFKSQDFSAFIFTINDQVEVTESYIPEFSISVFLGQLGGSLGLWLGVGAVQLINIGVNLLNRS